MVDITKIKPGDKVVIHPSDGMSRTLHASDEVDSTSWLLVDDGQRFDVADPHVCESPLVVRLKSDRLPSGVFRCRAEYLDLVEPSQAVVPESKCSCDTMALMRVGCRCGHIQREREAAR
jgi:hypothetical protein